MAPRVLVHVGLQKSGSTYLQNGLAAVAADLQQHGVLYPVRESEPGKVPNHQLAVYGLLPGMFPWVADDAADAAAEEWAWLQAVLAAADEPVLLSAEVLSYLGRDEVRQVVDALPTDDVRVLVTSRRLDRLLTSSWQQNVRHGDPTGLVGFLQSRAANREAYANDLMDIDPWHVWRAFDTASTVTRWSDAVGSEHVTLVTSAAGPPEQLWHRFLAALDVPGVAEVAPPEVPTDGVNESLRWAEAEVLAGISARLVEDGWATGSAARFLRILVHDGFMEAPLRGERIVLPGDWGRAVTAWSTEELERLTVLKKEGLRVVGDLEELEVPSDCAARGPEAPSLDDLRLAAATAVVSAVRAAKPAPSTWFKVTASSGRRALRRVGGRLRPGG